MRNALLRSGLAIALCATYISVGHASDAGPPETAAAASETAPAATSLTSVAPAPPPPPVVARQLPPKSPIDRYELGPGDLLRIRFYEREDLSGDFRVRADGRIGLPMLGIFYVQGKDADELEQEIIAAFTAATARRPQVLVEVLERRPFYATGLVNKPGPYPYVPHMTVLHALTIAGGLLRTTTADTPISQLVATNKEISHLRQAEASLKRLVARHTRLTAERERRPTVQASNLLIELAGKAEAEELMSGEIRLMQQRNEALSQRKKGHAESIARIREEIRELEAQTKQTKEQVRLNTLQLDDLNELREKGLSRRPQLLQLQTLIAGYEARSLEINAAIARAHRSLEETERSMVSLDLDQKVQIEQEIVETEKQIASTELEVQEAKKLIEQMTGMPVEVATANPNADMSFTIIRYDDDRYLTIDADEKMLLRPGDILRVGLKQGGSDKANVTQRLTSQAKQGQPGH
jgi:protein involved in polysaccharide export with SLBB domain